MSIISQKNSGCQEIQLAIRCLLKVNAVEHTKSITNITLSHCMLQSGTLVYLRTLSGTPHDTQLLDVARQHSESLNTLTTHYTKMSGY